MQADLLPFIDWSHHPRQIVAPRERIATAGDPTDCCFCEDGVALAPDAALCGHHHRADPAKGRGGDITMRQALCCPAGNAVTRAYRHDVLAHGNAA